MLPAHYNKKEASYFCRFTFGQFFTILVLEIFTLFFIFYLGSRYGRELLGIETAAVQGKTGLEVTTTHPEHVATTSDPEIRALAKDILESAPTSDLKQKVEEMLKGSGGGKEVVSRQPSAVSKKEEIPIPQADKPVAERPQPIIETAPVNAKYSIQVGSYPNPDEAHLMVTQWQEKGYPAFLLSAEIPGKGRWYRVRLGSFETKPEAQSFLETFKQKEGVEAFIASNF